MTRKKPLDFAGNADHVTLVLGYRKVWGSVRIIADFTVTHVRTVLTVEGLRERTE